MRVAAALGNSNVFGLSVKPGGGLLSAFNVIDSTLLTESQRGHATHFNRQIYWVTQFLLHIIIAKLVIIKYTNNRSSLDLNLFTMSYVCYVERKFSTISMTNKLA